jgi:hypothetical protein
MTRSTSSIQPSCLGVITEWNSRRLEPAIEFTVRAASRIWSLLRNQAVPLVAVAHEVKLVVEDELAGERLGTRRRHLGLRRFGRIDLEQAAEDLVHGDEGRRHAAGAAQEAAPVEAEPAPVALGQFLDAGLHHSLCRTLRQRIELAVRHHLCRYRRAERSLVGDGE